VCDVFGRMRIQLDTINLYLELSRDLKNLFEIVKIVDFEYTALLEPYRDYENRGSNGR